MKKIISLVVSAAMLLMLVGGITSCGNSSKTAALTWVQVGDIQEGDERILEEANKIIEPELGLKLKIEYIDTASFGEKAKYKMASGEDFDIIWTGYLNDYQSAVSMGGLMDITSYIDNIKMSDGTTAKMSDAVENYFLESAFVDGKIYGVPNMQVVSNPYTYKLRKSLADECGIDVKGLQTAALNVKDSDTANAYMKKLSTEMEKAHSKRPDLFTVNPGTNPAFKNVYEEILCGVGIKKDGSSTDIVNIKDTEEFKCGVDATYDWFEKGYIRKDIASKGNAIESVDDEKQYAFTQTTWKPGQDISDAAEMGEEIAYSFMESPLERCKTYEMKSK